MVSVTFDAAAGAQHSAPAKSVQPLPEVSAAADKFAALITADAPADLIRRRMSLPQSDPAPQPLAGAHPQARGDNPSVQDSASAQPPGSPITGETTDASAGVKDASPAAASAQHGQAPAGDTKSSGKSVNKSTDDGAQSDAKTQDQTSAAAAQTPGPVAAAVVNTTAPPSAMMSGSGGSSASPLDGAAISVITGETSATTAAGAGIGQAAHGDSAAGPAAPVTSTQAQAQDATGAPATTGFAAGPAGAPELQADGPVTATLATIVATTGAVPPPASPFKGAASQKAAAAASLAATANDGTAGLSTDTPAAAANTPATGDGKPAGQPQANIVQDSGAALAAAISADKARGGETASPPSRDPTAIAAASGPQALPDPFAAIAQPPPTQSLAGTPTVSVASPGAAIPLSGLAVEIAASALSGRTRFEVRLDPADLGRIDVRIDVSRSGQVTSHLIVEKPETLSMLKQDAPQLQQALTNAGVKTDGGGLQFSLRDQWSGGQQNSNPMPGQPQRLIISDETDGPAPVLVGQSYGRLLGSSGGIDIRV